MLVPDRGNREGRSKPGGFGEEHPKGRKGQKPVAGTGLEAGGTPVWREVKAGSTQSLTGHRKEYGFYSNHDWKPLKDVRQGSKVIWEQVGSAPLEGSYLDWGYWLWSLFSAVLPAPRKSLGPVDPQ